jgi:hypothetical protein
MENNFVRVPLLSGAMCSLLGLCAAALAVGCVAVELYWVERGQHTLAETQKTQKAKVKVAKESASRFRQSMCLTSPRHSL